MPLVPLIHGPAEDAIEAQSAAAGPDGREAGSKATELAWLFALTTRKGKKTIWGHNLMRQVQAMEMLGRAVDEMVFVMHINGYPAVRNEMQSGEMQDMSTLNTKQME